MAASARSNEYITSNITIIILQFAEILSLTFFFGAHTLLVCLKACLALTFIAIIISAAHAVLSAIMAHALRFCPTGDFLSPFVCVVLEKLHPFCDMNHIL